MNGYINIASHTTFGVPAWVKSLHTFDSLASLQAILASGIQKERLLIVGGGSNMLCTQPFDGVVLKNELKGIEIVSEDSNETILKVAGGEVWHDFVLYTVNKGLGGIENLSLIPGSVGASPIQNIGAYGVEIKDVFHSLEAVEIATGQLKTFTLDECNFGYRESIFKHTLKDQYIIISVSYRLRTSPEINTSYGAINDELAAMEITHPTVKDVSDAVIRIRESKLPNPKEVGNAGSFFKNPVVSKSIYTVILQSYPNAPSYPIDAEHVKVPAGWLIETAGWKGFTEDNYGVHKKQALVLVNYGGAEGQSIYTLSDRIIRDIKEKFKITLEREVNIF